MTSCRSARTTTSSVREGVSAANSAVCLRDRHHQRRSGFANKLLFERFSCTRARRPTGYRRGHRVGSPGRGDPARVREIRAYVCRAGSQCHHLSRKVVGAGHGPARLAFHRASKMRGVSRSAGGVVSTRMRIPIFRVRYSKLAAQIEGYPRHLGIHSGGMVICDRPHRRRFARWSGRGWPIAVSCSGTRTIVLPLGWSSSIYSGSACSRLCIT